ncbi:cupin domain-containing protein, partial [Acinetobacter baumannii]|uniref:cupin domain-containing protein n=1 Tax=Acinetobacter baumannii TaxID=470 RepID=UPI003CC7AB29
MQAHGHRRWQIDASPNPPLAFRDDVDLKLLRRFTASHDWVLAPGDMLYLPPGVPHNGVAEDACLTFSVGMRAPSARTDRRLPGHPGGRRRRGSPLPGRRPHRAGRSVRDRRGGDGPGGRGAQRPAHE